MVIPVSTPHPRASGVAASNASRVRQRIPDRGCAGVQPVREAMARRAAPTTIPRPPAPGCGGSRAIDMSTARSKTGGTRDAVFTAVSPRSPSMNSSSRAGRSSVSRMATIAAPVSIAAALPRLWEWRTTTAPASRATSWVLSTLPSSTTRTRSTCGIARAERTVAAIRRDSSLAGMITATRCLVRLRRPTLCSGETPGLRDIVVPPRAAASRTSRGRLPTSVPSRAGTGSPDSGSADGCCSPPSPTVSPVTLPA